jgi:hypothetical protein
MKQIVAFIGPIECGKSTAAAFCSAELGYRTFCYASPLKDMLLAMGLTSLEVYGSEKQIKSLLLGGKTPRQAMQTLGTDWGRDLIHKDLWLNLMGRRLDNCSEKKIAIDDARFPNEFTHIKSMNGKIIRVFRAGKEVKPSHESEAHYLDADVDYHIVNDGNLLKFKKAVVFAINHLFN